MGALNTTSASSASADADPGVNITSYALSPEVKDLAKGKVKVRTKLIAKSTDTKSTKSTEKYSTSRSKSDDIQEQDETMFEGISSYSVDSYVQFMKSIK